MLETQLLENAEEEVETESTASGIPATLEEHVVTIRFPKLMDGPLIK